MRRIGPGLIFERLWKETGLKEVIEGLRAPVVSSSFPWSGLYSLRCSTGCLHQVPTVSAPSGCVTTTSAPKSWIFIISIAPWLGWVKSCRMNNRRQDALSSRVKDLIEEELFFRTRNLFSSLDLVFFDTTSIYFEGEGGETLGKRGHTKDHRPDLKQMVVGAVIDNEGRPICCELWPGNTADVKSLVPVVDRLRKRFSLGRVCVVADRGMISQDTIEELE